MRRGIVSIALLLASSLAASEPAPPPSAKLDSLRRTYAERFLEPEAHMQLARYCHDSGDRLMAFFILEAARRGYFEAPVFDRAFEQTFLGKEPFDNSAAAEGALQARLAAAPDDLEAQVKLADVYVSRSDWPQAETHLRRALALDPEHLASLEALGRIFGLTGRGEQYRQEIERFFEARPNALFTYVYRSASLSESEPEKALALLVEAKSRHPTAWAIDFQLAYAYLGLNRLDEAAAAFEGAAAAAPDSEIAQAWTGRFFLKARKDPAKALHYYLNAYFLNPHTYDTEFAESRIQHLVSDAAEAVIQEHVAKGADRAELLASANPAVVSRTLSAFSEAWDARLTESSIELMKHDDPGVRWQATAVLLARMTSEEVDRHLETLLESQDLRQRSLAAYLAVGRWRERGVALVRSRLKEPVQLLRYDAFAALAQLGGEAGRRVLEEHRTSETDPRILALYDRLKAQEDYEKELEKPPVGDDHGGAD